MKKPVLPPQFDSLFSLILEKGQEVFLNLMQNAKPIDNKGRYIHWDKLRHLPSPDGLTSEEWWFSIKVARKQSYQPTSLVDESGLPFQFVSTSHMLKELHWLDRYAAGSIQADKAITNNQTRNTYLIRSLIEEATSSSQLEGASTTRDVAKEMIRQNRHPKDKSEQMILNNYIAMQFIRDYKDEALTPSLILELHKILTHNTLDDSAIGRLRTSEDDIHVIDNATQEKLHTPPHAEQLTGRLEKLCDFANDDHESSFLHPVIKAITLHFMLAYDHPFCDGNGRTARALFYWSVARQGYWLMEFISISRIIKNASAQYGKAFLYSETDDNDLTYFIYHQLDVIHKAIDDLHLFLESKMKGISEAEQMLRNNKKLSGRLNFRQLALLKHALKHPRFSYVIEEHMRSHGISYDVARKDLLQMADDLKLLLKSKQGKRYYFVVPNDLEKIITSNV